VPVDCEALEENQQAQNVGIARLRHAPALLLLRAELRYGTLHCVE